MDYLVNHLELAGIHRYQLTASDLESVKNLDPSGGLRPQGPEYARDR
jgi:hypothetical protein